MRCPVCRSSDVIPKECLYHPAQPGATLPHRCDSAWKCTDCAHVYNFGIVIPDEVWGEHVPFGEETRRIDRPETRRLLGPLAT